MKIITMLFLTLSFSLFAQSDWVEKSDIAEASDASRKSTPEKAAHDAAVVKVQVDEDEANKNFISEAVSREAMYTLCSSVQLARGPGRFVLYELLSDTKNISASLDWSHAIAKNKYAIGEARLNLPRAVVAAAVKKGWFKASKSLLNCEGGKVSVKSVDADNLTVSLYPSQKITGQLFRASAAQVEAVNASLNEFISIATKKAKEEKLTSLTGVVFAFTQNGKALQSCDLKISL